MVVFLLLYAFTITDKLPWHISKIVCFELLSKLLFYFNTFSLYYTMLTQFFSRVELQMGGLSLFYVVLFGIRLSFGDNLVIEQFIYIYSHLYVSS